MGQEMQAKAMVDTRARILTHFESLSSELGPKSVGMAGLASELGISTKTLYKHFPTKALLLEALIDSWATRWQEMQSGGFQLKLNARARIERSALIWLEQTSRFAPVFWQQLERDFPEAFAHYDTVYRAYLERSRQNLLPAIRGNLNADLALAGLMALLAQASDTALCEKCDITKKQAVKQAVAIWARGALIPEEV